MLQDLMSYIISELILSAVSDQQLIFQQVQNVEQVDLTRHYC